MRRFWLAATRAMSVVPSPPSAVKSRRTPRKRSSAMTAVTRASTATAAAATATVVSVESSTIGNPSPGCPTGRRDSSP